MALGSPLADPTLPILLDNYVASAVFSAVLFGALSFAWRRYRQRYLGLWAAYWAVYAAVWAGSVALLSMGPGAPRWAAGTIDFLASTSGFAGRLVLVLGVLDFAGVAVGPHLVQAGGTAVAAFSAGVLLLPRAFPGPVPAALGAAFHGFTLGFVLFAWLAAFLAWRSRRHPHAGARWLLAGGIASLALSDGFDLYGFLRGAGDAAAAIRSDRISALLDHFCDALVAVGMWAGAIGEEWQRAESALQEARRSEARLQQAQRLESIGRLAGGIAHDFNNLLTAVLSNLTLVEDRLPPEHAARGEVRDAIAAGERAAGLTRQLLTFARRQVVVPRLVDLNESVASMERMLSRLIGEHVALRARLAAGLWPVRIDPSQLEQLVVNLVVNARDAIAGTGTITVETSNEVSGRGAAAGADPGPSEGEWVRLAVEDTGAGMDEATQARIFEPFFSTKEGRGTGLGLATVHGIVREAGGQIRVVSAPGAGARFLVWLPRVAAAAGDLRPAPAEAPAGPRGGRETVLVAEDDPQVRSVAARVLARNGYRVLEASDGRAALERAAVHDGAIDLLVADAVMPEIGGRDLAEELARRRPGLRVLFVSGYAEGMDPAAAFLAKPYTHDQLVARVREVLDGPPAPPRPRGG